MKRRKFIKNCLLTGGAVSLGGALTWHHFFDGPVFNACKIETLPENLQQHELMGQALKGLNMGQLWDCHFHLVGTGANLAVDGKKSNIWLSPNMTSWKTPKQRVQYGFYLDAACIDDAELADRQYIQNVAKVIKTAPEGVKFMLLAFDYYHDDKGNARKAQSTFYVPNEYAARMGSFNDGFEWIGSVHPYREDALEQLEWCAQHGAKAIKWLPPAMNIDPSLSRCERYYSKLIELGLPLLTHAGEEQAVHSDELQRLSNPLLLRRPLEQGVKVIVAHCASLGQSEDIESQGRSLVSNFDLFARLMDYPQYENNLLADISAINLFNRDVNEIKQLITNQHWHERLLYASDYPLPGVMPIISATNLASHQLLDESQVMFLNQVREHNVWLFDFLLKRLMQVGENRFLDSVFNTRRHFINE
ncbi:amidohydrolase family protein [Aliikangiella coralliicola]|uniref:Amidohydrolase family protein n=1 Tax=Aliikangiella coralliicola TaxID=2592383 RepID=A0A545UAF1_9GAMM|nr:amidohydrolase family protein [Aliikangiella coralliicola]TQV86445.1 amidohydrolase family protein [Aliikangiella coralliicola]